MEEFLHSITRVLSHNIVVHVYSLPNFSIESFVTSLICIVHILLIMEINSLVNHITEKSIEKIKRKRGIKEENLTSNSKISIAAAGEEQKDRRTMRSNLQKYYDTHTPFYNNHHPSMKKFNNTIRDMEKEDYWFSYEGEKYEKLDQILSVSPSEYIRKDKEKKIHQDELGHCLRSLTTLLEYSVASKMSSTSLAKSICLIKDHIKVTNSKIDLMELDNEDDDSNKKIKESNRKTTECLYNMIEKSLKQSLKDDKVTSHGDITLGENDSICSLPSDTSGGGVGYNFDLEIKSNVTDFREKK